MRFGTWRFCWPPPRSNQWRTRFSSTHTFGSVRLRSSTSVRRTASSSKRTASSCKHPTTHTRPLLNVRTVPSRVNPGDPLTKSSQRWQTASRSRQNRSCWPGRRPKARSSSRRAPRKTVSSGTWTPATSVSTLPVVYHLFLTLVKLCLRAYRRRHCRHRRRWEDRRKAAARPCVHHTRHYCWSRGRCCAGHLCVHGHRRTVSCM